MLRFRDNWCTVMQYFNDPWCILRAVMHERQCKCLCNNLIWIRNNLIFTHKIWKWYLEWFWESSYQMQCKLFIFAKNRCKKNKKTIRTTVKIRCSVTLRFAYLTIATFRIEWDNNNNLAFTFCPISIFTRVTSEIHHITIVKTQITTLNSRQTHDID